MLKKFQLKHNETTHTEPSPNSFTYITPNSRKVPLPPAPNEAYDVHGSPWQQHPQYSFFDEYEEPSNDVHKYNTFHDRESLIDSNPRLPSNKAYEQLIDSSQSDLHSTRQANQASPVQWTQHQEALGATSTLFNVKNLHYTNKTMPSDPEIRTMEPPTPVRSRMHTTEHQSIQVEYSFANIAEALAASVEATFIDQPMSDVYKSNPSPPSSDGLFTLQPAPLKNKQNQPVRTSSKPVSSTRQHPSPLAPLVIPPTPSRLTSPAAQSGRVMMPSRSSSIPDLLPQLTPGSLTPGSLTSTSSGGSLSPLPSAVSVSPQTPSPHFQIPVSPQSTSEQKQKVADQKKQPSATLVEELVADGIKFHEAGQLEKATELFRQAATKDFPIAMFLYGVSLRHGWGCKKNEHLAFQYLQKAAEYAVLDLNGLTSTVNTSASKGELIMAIYELGVSFRHGWGCKKNKETAFYFFKIAADLGDPDAQNDLGHCYYNGHGAKKDLYMAAKYYRLADKQGQGIMGNSWIHKTKYDHPK
ncbi:hypothetical protein BDF14DRAFT_1881063 [Spinellus fusiger]|nr:hypothetical protein BDF14DRAFT_1881063 [Spinellus fusiger]